MRMALTVYWMKSVIFCKHSCRLLANWQLIPSWEVHRDFFTRKILRYYCKINWKGGWISKQIFLIFPLPSIAININFLPFNALLIPPYVRRKSVKGERVKRHTTTNEHIKRHLGETEPTICLTVARSEFLQQLMFNLTGECSYVFFRRGPYKKTMNLTHCCLVQWLLGIPGATSCPLAEKMEVLQKKLKKNLCGKNLHPKKTVCTLAFLILPYFS